MKRGGFKRKFGTGKFIKDYLQKEPSYQRKIWSDLVTQYGERYRVPTYDNFRSYFSRLKKHGLVEKYGEEKSDWGKKSDWGVNRIYYRLNPEKLDDPAWTNPRRKLKKN